MQMEFVRRMPLPQELLRDYPIGEEMKRRKAARDGEIADILTGRDDRLLLIIGPCSADREDAVLDYMHRLSEVDAQVRERLMLVPRVYTNKPSTKRYLEQIRICKDVMHSRALSQDIRRLVKGLMVESYLEDGCQKPGEGVYGKSITDPCLGWDKTRELIYRLAEY